jgi:hypothetical protein
MYGLRGIDSHFQEVQDVVSILVRKIEASSDMFNIQVVSNCLYGIQHMSSEDEAVRFLDTVIRSKVEQMQQGGSSKGIA